MSATAEALQAAGYRQSRFGSQHCSACKHYAATTKAGEGRCAENEGAAVYWEDVCDLFERRPMPLDDDGKDRGYETADEQARWDEAQDNASRDRAEAFEHTEDVP